MKLKTFKKGVHPEEFKYLSEQKPLERMKLSVRAPALCPVPFMRQFPGK